MAPARLFEKVDALRSEGELDKVQALLEEAWAQGTADKELTEEDRAALQEDGAFVMAWLRQLVVFAEEPASAGGAGGSTRTVGTPFGGRAASMLHSPLLKPLSPPPVDAEVQRLEVEVTAASLRVAELRTSMQARLQEQLAAKLAACRPTADLDPAAAAAAPSGSQQEADAAGDGVDAAAAAGQQGSCGAPEAAGSALAAEGEQQAQQQAEGGEAAQPMDVEGGEAAGAAKALLPPAPQLWPQPQELQERLLSAANRMPALRARLEQATDRLQRVVAAVAADVSRAPPNTVERAVLGKTPGRPAANAAAAKAGEEENVPGVSPLLKQAMASGQIDTRPRRVARDVQPLPYSQAE